MANPRDSIGANATLNGERYLNEKTGRTHVRLPAGGTGGGVTSYADMPASEEDHVAFLDAEAKRKEEEGKALRDQHGEAHKELEKHQAKEREEARKREEQDRRADDEGEKPFVTNPIGAETYGRPPLNPPGLDGAPQQHNPADERDPVDDQPRTSSMKEHEAV